MSKSKVTEGAEDFAMPAAVETKSTEEAEENENAMAEEKAYDDSTPQDENIRENMSETAFFYPQLTTDHNGTVSLKFTLPETLTSWLTGLSLPKSFLKSIIWFSLTASL